MSDQSFNIDDPGNVNRFISLMKGNKDSAQSVPANGEDATSKASQLEVAGNDIATAQDHIAQLLIAASSALETNTAPPKSANVPAPDTDVTTGDPLEVARLAILSTIAKSKQNLEDSKYAPKNYNKSSANPATPTRNAPAKSSFSNRFSPLGVDQPEMSPSTRSQDKVIAKFLREQTLDAGEKSAPSSTNLSSSMENGKPDAADAALASKVTGLKTERPAYPKINTGAAALEHNKKSPNEPNVEDREHLKHFSSWGTPPPRNRPASRIRKIILSNLPAGSDLTLVQSLVYGGAVESFDFMKPSKTSAWVIFVNADACDAFFEAHPNGIVFKNPKTCRDHVVYVGKGDVVDVVSSVLQAYLDCQASRVVRATGADEEWGMRALYKVAEAKNRKVEKIVDTYRDKVRTIIFRFTNIADAVGFRQQLMRDADWEMCNVQFMVDPVETATGVHLEV